MNYEPTIRVLLLLLITLVLFQASNAQDCASMSNCTQCLESECVWIDTDYGCLSSCNVIADTSCYDPEFFPNATTNEICAIAQSNDDFAALCAAQMNCADCVNKTNSDGSMSCQWHPNEEVCDDGGNPLLEPGVFDCTCSFNNCEDCLQSECVWIDTDYGCLSSCDEVADTACYDPEFFPNATTNEICSIAQANDDFAALCASQMSCSDCVSKTNSDGSMSCQWHPNEEVCDDGGNPLFEPGVFECTCSFDTCEDCLQSECVWIDKHVGCLSSCNMISDTTCYHPEFFPNATTNEICAIAQANDDFAALCASQMNCKDCVSKTNLAGSMSCQWHPNEKICDDGGNPFLEPGVFECTCSFDTCEECFQSGSECAWSPEAGCLSSCDVTADVTCFPAGSNVTEVCIPDAADNFSTKSATDASSAGRCSAISMIISILILLLAELLML